MKRVLVSGGLLVAGLTILGIALPAKRAREPQPRHTTARHNAQVRVPHVAAHGAQPGTSHVGRELNRLEANRHALERQKDPNMGLCIAAGLTAAQCRADREHAESVREGVEIGEGAGR